MQSPFDRTHQRGLASHYDLQGSSIIASPISDCHRAHFDKFSSPHFFAEPLASTSTSNTNSNQFTPFSSQSDASSSNFGLPNELCDHSRWITGTGTLFNNDNSAKDDASALPASLDFDRVPAEQTPQSNIPDLSSLTLPWVFDVRGLSLVGDSNFQRHPEGRPEARKQELPPAYRAKRKAPLSLETRKKAKTMRKIGSCLRCHRLKESVRCGDRLGSSRLTLKCDDGTPCRRCLDIKSTARKFIFDCYRDPIREVIAFRAGVLSFHE